MSTLDWLAGAGSAVRGEIAVPGDKSVSHRAIMFASLADGESQVHGFLEGEDTRATAAIFAKLGVRIDAAGVGSRAVQGVGIDGLHGCAEALDCGNAGTGMRLLAGLLAGQRFDSVLVGDASLSKRPMARVIDPIVRMGGLIESDAGGLPPLRIRGGRALHGIDYTLPVASAQVKSAVLLAGLYAHGETHIREPHPTRDYSERMLRAFGWPIAFGPGWARLSGGHRLQPTQVQVPADFSSAAFFIVAASLVPGSDLLLRAVGMNPRRTGLLTVLRAMGADIVESPCGEQGGEPVADLRVRHARLRGIAVPEACVPDMIDEFPVLFAAAALAEGTTVVTAAAELRVKESDRIATMASGLRALGARIDETPDGAVIHGGTLHGGEAHAHGDHRIAMALVVAAQCASGEVRVVDCANVATSFPGFDDLARGIGFGLRG
ncbi:MAG: 3-phosphoshikimate 1-carboxyvinyltransferase [Gammaproteobacteria bacterium HGW-Gammaproteobacteria-4]|jgi:3-phosphoshikimate 1-carboxyvinyltransferase|nr:MAG: 3-phosphoshikimate 1-carboxyvinyltransferase [Gammaproteobacteria bacterium HGW-Gammaproteobacteria-4]